MGLPTAAAYILVATLAAPALEQLGVNKLAAHLFVFYSAMLSAITPPVALAAYAASGIARANPFRIAVIACQFGCAAFIVPYFFVYNPALLGINATPLIVLQAAISAIAGGFALAVALQGWLLRKINMLERAGFAAVAALMLQSGIQTDLIGIVLLAALVAYQIADRKRRTSHNPPETTTEG
jgi:TRAP-type uncharacterized transport system fused permease subunit